MDTTACSLNSLESWYDTHQLGNGINKNNNSTKNTKKNKITKKNKNDFTNGIEEDIAIQNEITLINNEQNANYSLLHNNDIDTSQLDLIYSCRKNRNIYSTFFVQYTNVARVCQFYDSQSNSICHYMIKFDNEIKHNKNAAKYCERHVSDFHKIIISNNDINSLFKNLSSNRKNVIKLKKSLLQDSNVDNNYSEYNKDDNKQNSNLKNLINNNLLLTNDINDLADNFDNTLQNGNKNKNYIFDNKETNSIVSPIAHNNKDIEILKERDIFEENDFTTSKKRKLSNSESQFNKRITSVNLTKLLSILLSLNNQQFSCVQDVELNNWLQDCVSINSNLINLGNKNTIVNFNKRNNFIIEFFNNISIEINNQLKKLFINYKKFLQRQSLNVFRLNDLDIKNNITSYFNGLKNANIPWVSVNIENVQIPSYLLEKKKIVCLTLNILDSHFATLPFSFLFEDENDYSNKGKTNKNSDTNGYKKLLKFIDDLDGNLFLINFQDYEKVTMNINQTFIKESNGLKYPFLLQNNHDNNAINNNNKDFKKCDIVPLVQLMLQSLLFDVLSYIDKDNEKENIKPIEMNFGFVDNDLFNFNLLNTLTNIRTVRKLIEINNQIYVFNNTEVINFYQTQIDNKNKVPLPIKISLKNTNEIFKLLRYTQKNFPFLKKCPNLKLDENDLKIIEILIEILSIENIWNELVNKNRETGNSNLPIKNITFALIPFIEHIRKKATFCSKKLNLIFNGTVEINLKNFNEVLSNYYSHENANINNTNNGLIFKTELYFIAGLFHYDADSITESIKNFKIFPLDIFTNVAFKLLNWEIVSIDPDNENVNTFDKLNLSNNNSDSSQNNNLSWFTDSEDFFSLSKSNVPPKEKIIKILKEIILVELNQFKKFWLSKLYEIGHSLAKQLKLKFKLNKDFTFDIEPIEEKKDTFSDAWIEFSETTDNFYFKTMLSLAILEDYVKISNDIKNDDFSNHNILPVIIKYVASLNVVPNLNTDEELNKLNFEMKPFKLQEVQNMILIKNLLNRNIAKIDLNEIINNEVISKLNEI